MSTENGMNYAWERVRYLTRKQANHSMRLNRWTKVFEPGDIARCEGSIERAFSNHLQSLAIPLEEWEKAKNFKQPTRFCVVNKRFDNGSYEVFLMTTFGQARTFDELGPIAQKYGIPVGGMNWFEDIDPVQTYPPSFGWERKSFIFAIPVISREVALAATIPWAVRLVPGELGRLRKISDEKMRNTHRNHRLVRQSLKHRYYKFSTAPSVDDEQDDFLPSEEENDVIEAGQGPPLPILDHCLKVGRFPLPARYDLSWLLSHASHRIYNYSTYLDHRGIHRKGPIQLSLSPENNTRPTQIPKPYYSPYLRINIRAISRILA